MFKKILIANRGEIAIRIIRACRELGIKCVAIYSQADAGSLHVHYADEAICIGPPPPAQSYLHIPSIISAAEIADVEAIHPGYGFLSEDAHFAEICESCNIQFIGPPARVIHALGDKAAARKLMKKGGIPVVPGSEGVVETKEEALKIARKIGYPVMIKAAGGGGGRGLRIAHNDFSLVNAFMTARAEAEVSFGNRNLYIEKYLDRPRHVEFQILADRRGRVVHLNERDCTIQRRHQKLVEECPSPVLDTRMRRKMGRMAVRAAEIVEYVNAGTVEFLLDRHGKFCFIEINTRVQVEHPVTEIVTGVDIVKEQIRIAAGRKLKFEQKDMRINGHAIECRINSENPDGGFTPCPGRITNFQAPGGPGVRLDTHVYAGYDIPPYYDSLLAKLIASGRTRETAILRMQRALGEFVIEGVKTTIPLFRALLNDPRFRRGKYSTDFLEKFLEKKGKKKGGAK